MYVFNWTFALYFIAFYCFIAMPIIILINRFIISTLKSPKISSPPLKITIDMMAWGIKIKIKMMIKKMIRFVLQKNWILKAKPKVCSSKVSFHEPSPPPYFYSPPNFISLYNSPSAKLSNPAAAEKSWMLVHQRGTLFSELLLIKKPLIAD